MIFGYRAFKEVLRSLGWALIQYVWCLIRRKQLDRDMHRGKSRGRYRERMANHKPRKKASEETNLADTLISDLSLQNFEKINFCCLIHVVCGTLLYQSKQTNISSFKEGPSPLGMLAVCCLVSQTGIT